VLAGLLWDLLGPAATFLAGAAFALLDHGAALRQREGIAFMTRFLPAGIAMGVAIAVATLTRVALMLRPEVFAAGGLVDWMQALAYGLLFDTVAGLYLVAPFVLWLALLPDRVARWRAHGALMAAGLLGFGYGLIVVAIAEWLFWDEFGSRFNFIAVDYLLYTHEVLGNIWESYPVGRILIGLLLPAALLSAWLTRRMHVAASAPLRWRGAVLALAACGIAIALTLRYVNSDLKSFAREDAPNDIAGNGVYEFFAANYRNELDYDRHYATLPLGEAMSLVRDALHADGGSWVAPDGPGVERLIDPGRPERRLNVVLVSVESLGAEYLGAYGDRRRLTPNLDRLARESLWFSNVYATGNRTVRGLEALSLALPPTPGQSIVRRPNNDALFSLGSVFEDKDYSVLFAYGGYGYFDNMNAFFDANDYRSVDRRGIPASRIEFENIWGVADEHLYDQVIEEMDRALAAHPGQPVFAHVMTTSNHRPYTYPPGRIDIASGTGREGAVKYTDYAIGRLIESARRRPWFDDTVFVIVADHGANARGTTRIPVDKYLIPVMLYAPKHIAAQRVDRLMSQIDVAPTLLGVLEFRYYNKFFGRDMLHAPARADRAFVANYQALGYMTGRHLVMLHPKRKVEVFRIDPGGRITAPAEDPALVREAIAFYQGASHVFRSGLYRDEEQLAPERRTGAPAHVARR